MISNLATKKENCVIEFLSTSIIKIAKYQKALNKQRVQEIIDKFDQHRMRPIEVSYRDGQYWVFDGQHRLAAYIAMGITMIPCQIHFGLTYEQEAMLFARQQDNVGAVRTMHKWNALCEAKDEATVRMKEIAIKHGYTIVQGGAMNRRIMAVKELQTIVRDIGFDGLDDTLYITRACWNGNKYSTSVEILSGLRLFFKYHKKDLQYNRSRLEDTLKLVDPSVLIQKASAKDGANVGVRVAKAIEDVYNKKARGRQRISLKVTA